MTSTYTGHLYDPHVLEELPLKTRSYPPPHIALCAPLALRLPKAGV
ncbi:hypothetical protein AB0L85_31380 [Streptomyces sp. NPDC052051]